MHKLLAIARNLLNRPGKDKEEAAEIRAYVALLADEFQASGMSQSEAERAAKVHCGGVLHLEQTVRDRRTGIKVELHWQDIRFAFRQFRRHLLFTTVALVSLVVGTSATLAVLCVASSLTLHSLQFPDAKRLVTLSLHYRNSEDNALFSPDFSAMRLGKVHSFERIAGYTIHEDVNLTGGRIPQRLVCVAITANLMATLGVRPQLGREIAEIEDAQGSAPVVLISDRLWRSQFGSDTHLVGKSIMLNGEQHSVIGVLPPGFAFPDPSVEPDIYTQAAFPRATVFDGRAASPVKVIARLSQGATLTQADAEAKAFFQARLRIHPSDWSRDITLSVVSLQDYVSGNLRKPLLLLLGCVLCVLMVTCINIGSLQFARATSRTPEILIRNALGASRARVIRQFLIESFVLSVAASMMGLVVAWVSLRVIRDSQLLAAQPTAMAFGEHAFSGVFGKYGSAIHMDGAILLVSLALPLVTTAIFGIFPAVQATRSLSGLQPGAARMTPGYSRRRAERTLLIIEIAASITLLSSAGLLIRSFSYVMSLETGFDSGNVMTARVQLTGSRYRIGEELTSQSAFALRQFSSDVLRRLEALPDLKSAALTNVLPLDQAAMIQFSLDGGSEPSFDIGHFVTSIMISPEYFQVMGTPLLQGRTFGSDDAIGSERVLIVNRYLASHFFGNGAVGKRLYIKDFASAKRQFVWATIIGVVENVPHNGLFQPTKPEIYLPLSQAPVSDLEIAVRSIGKPSILGPAIVGAVASTDPDIPVSYLQTMQDRIAYRVALRKAIMMLMSCFAGLSTLLSAVGVGGMFAYIVTQRSREMGIRLALGASRAHLLRIVVGDAWKLINFGCLLGIVGAVFAGHFVSFMLVGVDHHDPKVLLSSLALVIGVALIAAFIPANRASRADVLAVLRDE